MSRLDLERFPTASGVYIMKDAKGTVLYVGKAKNLKSRVKQYFVPGGDGRPQIPFLMAKVVEIDTVVVSSEKEALILENNLIKQHQPKYNVFLKDDKGYLSIKMTKHQWPMLQLVRYKGKPKSDGTYFGPYTSSHAAKETFELIKRLFPLRRCSDRELAGRKRPCILYQIKRCVAPCVGYCSKEEYDDLAEQTAKFLHGKNREVLHNLRKAMDAASTALNFERAGEILKTIEFIEETIERQKVEHAGSGDRDIFAIYRQGTELSMAQMEYREGKLLNVQNYDFSDVVQDDSEILESFILQHYGEQDFIPNEIVLPLVLERAGLLADLISQGKKRYVHLHMPLRGEKKALLEMAQQNAKAAFDREKDVKVLREKMLLELKEKFHLTNYPAQIECFDNSNIGGQEAVSAMAVFSEGEKNSSQYRKFKLKGASGYDDYAALHEVLTRRYTRAKQDNHLPDLIIIDGGKGHLNIALQVLKELNIISVDIISVAKEEGRHDKGMTSEQVFLPNIKDPILFKPHSSILHFLQQIRDEAHRFAITYQRLRRKKKSFQSALDHLPGIGPAKRALLLRRFGSVKRIREASLDDLKSIKGLSQKDIFTLREVLKHSGPEEAET